MKNYDQSVKKKKKNHNPNQPYISNYPKMILIIGGLVSGKTKLYETSAIRY